MREELWDAPTTVYRIYAPSGALLYVGMTHRFLYRKAQHETGSCRYAGCIWVTAVYPNRHEAERAEYVAIRDEGPLHNDTRSLPRRLKALG